MITHNKNINMISIKFKDKNMITTNTLLFNFIVVVLVN